MTQVRRLLVLDDDPTLQGRYKKELESEGYQVSFATNGRDGLKKIREDRPDLVILDLALLGTDGLQVLGWILEESECLPLLVNSKDPVYPNQFTQRAVNVSLDKLKDLSRLKRAIRSLFEREHEVVGDWVPAHAVGRQQSPESPVPVPRKSSLADTGPERGQRWFAPLSLPWHR